MSPYETTYGAQTLRQGTLRLIRLHFHISPSRGVISGMILFTLALLFFLYPKVGNVEN